MRELDIDELLCNAFARRQDPSPFQRVDLVDEADSLLCPLTDSQVSVVVTQSHGSDSLGAFDS